MKRRGDEAPPHISKRKRTRFDQHVDVTLRAQGFEAGLSPLGEKWTRFGHRTILVARVQAMNPDLVYFYLEGPYQDVGQTEGREKLIEAGRSDERTFDNVLGKFLAMQDRHEGGAPALGGTDSAVFKTCTNCRREFTERQWDMLPILGQQTFDADDEGPAGALVMKNCPTCNSTLAMEIPL